MFVDKIFRELLTQLLQQPMMSSRAGNCQELRGVHFVLDGSKVQFLLNRRRAANPIYAAAEFLWHCDGTYDVTRLLPYAPNYTRFCEPGTLIARGAHGARIVGSGMYKTIVELLRANPTTRQAVIPIFDATDVACAGNPEVKDIPCAISWQFLIRNRQLHMFVNMRSNDIWLGFPYDVFGFTTFQKLVAGALGLDAGEYHHYIASCHLYEKYHDKAVEVIESPYEDIPYESQLAYYRGGTYDVQVALNIEQHIRTRFSLPGGAILERMPQPFKDFCVLCAWQFGCPDHPITSSQLTLALRTYNDSNRRA